MNKKLLELAVEIVQTQVATNKMSAEEIEAALMKIYNTLHQMQRAEEEGKSIDAFGQAEGAGSQESAAITDPRSSIHEDRVTCLECGQDFRQLTANHLRTHQLNPREYKRKWGFPLKQPLAAKSLTRMRSRTAKKRGLPPKLQQYLDEQRQRKETIAGESGHEGPSQRHRSRTGVS